jgi:gas vesicle protein
VKEGLIMNNMSFLKGMGVGMVVGSMVGMVAMPRKKKFSMGKALKSMGDVVENVTNAIGL